VEYVSKDNYIKIDDESILDTFSSQLTKFFNDKGSKVKNKR